MYNLNYYDILSAFLISFLPSPILQTLDFIPFYRNTVNMKDTNEHYSHKMPHSNKPLLKPIKERFSPRVFSDEPIAEEHIQTILEAARLTPSARNLQPWYFYYSHKGSQGYAKLLKGIPDMNRWCETAPLLILATYDESSPDGDINQWARYDLGAACMSLVLQAQSMGYYSRQIGLFDAGVVKNELNLPTSRIACVIIAIGKLGTTHDWDKVGEAHREKEKKGWERKDAVGERLG